jgi:hypothetical protein
MQNKSFVLGKENCVNSGALQQKTKTSSDGQSVQMLTTFLLTAQHFIRQ